MCHLWTWRLLEQFVGRSRTTQDMQDKPSYVGHLEALMQTY